MPRQPSCLCGECYKCARRLYMREWYQSKTPGERRAIVLGRDPEKVRAADRARYQRDKPKRHALTSARALRDRIERPEYVKAHNAVNNAVRDRRLTKGACEVCGETRVHAHHHDYSRPLDVRWLCAVHHRAEHRR